MGALSGLYLPGRQLAAYLPERYLNNPMTKAALHPVKNAPSFTHTAWVVWREDMPQQLRNVAARTLFDTVAKVKSAADPMFAAA